MTKENTGKLVMSLLASNLGLKLTKVHAWSILDQKSCGLVATGAPLFIVVAVCDSKIP